MNHIPYKGTGPALTDTMGWTTTLIFGSIAATMPLVKSAAPARNRVTTAKRIPALPDVAAIDETVKATT